MIPEKMYRYTNVLGEYICVPYKPNSGSSDYTEYTRTPVAKQFADEKPSPHKEGFYMCSDNGNFWVPMWWGEGKFHNEFEYQLVFEVPKYWCEIILPVIEEDV